MRIDLMEIIIFLVILLPAVVVHELAHAWVAWKCGDPTARMAGRLTLNPLKHIDPIGMFVVPVLLRMMGIIPLGWAKPVPVNFAALRNPKRDMIWVALAGPLSNLVIASLAAVLLKAGNSDGPGLFLSFVIYVNLMLFTFNLIPIPPLDGSRVVMGLLPHEMARAYSRLERWGFVIIIVLINVPGVMDKLSLLVALLASKFGVPSSL